MPPLESELVPITVYLPADIAARYRELADAEDRTLSAQCRHTLMNAVSRTVVIELPQYVGDPETVARELTPMILEEIRRRGDRGGLR